MKLSHGNATHGEEEAGLPKAPIMPAAQPVRGHVTIGTDYAKSPAIRGLLAWFREKERIAGSRVGKNGEEERTWFYRRFKSTRIDDVFIQMGAFVAFVRKKMTDQKSIIESLPGDSETASSEVDADVPACRASDRQEIEAESCLALLSEHERQLTRRRRAEKMLLCPGCDRKIGHPHLVLNAGALLRIRNDACLDDGLCGFMNFRWHDHENMGRPSFSVEESITPGQIELYFHNADCLRKWFNAITDHLGGK
ncbi:hypothetical protein [Propionivibrio dicarboxylicus]|uniref:Uncharacterized protein n=1 Tax=Propionivibrio dicarboxylicus TaxID=83767 RepID=A0A1G8AMH5_9RHOO|nr:hypothetical protein SAMN05660652_01436 [Propionivibrio dicarboxylicus]